MDNLSPQERSNVMGKVSARNTKPEMIVRRFIFALGYRYRLHAKDLPGHPDIVFRKRKKVIFIHGCFWHRHTCFNGQRVPKSRVEFWTQKFEANKKRDAAVLTNLNNMGWDALIVWECELKELNNIREKIVCFLERSAIEKVHNFETSRQHLRQLPN